MVQDDVSAVVRALGGPADPTVVLDRITVRLAERGRLDREAYRAGITAQRWAMGLSVGLWALAGLCAVAALLGM